MEKTIGINSSKSPDVTYCLIVFQSSVVCLTFFYAQYLLGDFSHRFAMGKIPYKYENFLEQKCTVIFASQYSISSHHLFMQSTGTN